MMIWKQLMLILPVMVAALTSVATAATKIALFEFTRTTKTKGIANWASVSPAVDAKIRQQVSAGAFPVRLKSDDWKSGPALWSDDLLAVNAQLTTPVVSNRKLVVRKE